MSAAIELQQLSKRYKEKMAVSPMTLTINEGELFGLLGLNGAGKTTVINMLSGLVKPSSGDALMLGYSLSKELPSIRKVLAVSPQETSIAPNLTAFLSGAWLDLSLIGGAFEKVAYALPFVHAVELVWAIVVEDFSAIFPHIYMVVIYAIVLFGLSVFIFKYKIQQN